MHTKSLMAVSLLLASMVHGTQVSGQTLSEGRIPTHCRLIIGSTIKRPIMDFGVADILTAPGQNYEVVKQLTVGGKTIEIHQYDRFYLSSLATGLVQIDQKREKAGKWELVATGKISLDGSKLWMRGPAEQVHADGTKAVVGEFFAFRVSDSGTHHGNSACRHRNAKDPFVCKRFHFEFYEDGDYLNIGHKPSAGYNIVPYTGIANCKAPENQTGDGDGDNGPDS